MRTFAVMVSVLALAAGPLACKGNRGTDYDRSNDNTYDRQNVDRPSGGVGGGPTSDWNDKGSGGVENDPGAGMSGSTGSTDQGTGSGMMEGTGMGGGPSGSDYMGKDGGNIGGGDAGKYDGGTKADAGTKKGAHDGGK